MSMLILPRATLRLRLGAFALLMAVGLHSNMGRAEGSSAPAQPENAPQPLNVIVPTTSFSPARVKTFGPLEYPVAAVRSSQEGWAVVSTMVDGNGKPYETAIMRSTRNAALDKAAVTALEHSTFEPATSDGRPTESAVEVKYRFLLDSPEGSASSAFVSAYEKFNNAMRGDGKMEAQAALRLLDGVNLYEDAFLGIAEYRYAFKYGTQSDQIAGLERAISDEKAPKYLPRAEFEDALRRFLILEVQTNHFQEAITAWEKLQQSSTDKKTLAALKPVMDQVNSLRTDPRPYAITGELTPSVSADGAPEGTWFLDLFKPRFRIEVKEGSLAEIKLRCDKKFLSFPFDPELEYHVESHFGQCEMQLLGAPGSRFTVIQSG